MGALHLSGGTNMWWRIFAAMALSALFGSVVPGLGQAQEPPEKSGSANPTGPSAPGEKPAPAKPANPDEANLASRLDKLQQELMQLSKAVGELKQEITVLRQGVATVDKSVDELKKDVAAVNTVLQQQMLAKRLDLLEQELARLRDTFKQEMDRLQSSIAQRSAPEVRKAFAAPIATGQVIIRNDWSLPVTVSVDGIAYTVSPGQEQRVVRTPGTFTYEVHGWQAPRSRTLEAGEQFLIRIAHP
jgi:ribosomal protein L29